MVSDFWSAYDAVAKHHQKCWPHLLRELKEIDKADESEEWQAFAKKLRIYGDGIRLKLVRDALGEEVFADRLDTLQKRLIDLGIAEYSHAHAHAHQLAKRLEKYWDALLTFVEHKDVPPSNNRAEREIRPAVLMRKASYGSGSDRGRRDPQRPQEHLPQPQATRHRRLGRDRSTLAHLHRHREVTTASRHRYFIKLMRYQFSEHCKK